MDGLKKYLDRYHKTRQTRLRRSAEAIAFEKDHTEMEYWQKIRDIMDGKFKNPDPPPSYPGYLLHNEKCWKCDGMGFVTAISGKSSNASALHTQVIPCPLCKGQKEMK